MQKEKTFNVAFDHKLYALGKTNDSVALYRITVEEQFHDEKHPNNMMFHNLKYIKKIADVPAGAIEEKTTIAYQQWSHQLPQV